LELHFFDRIASASSLAEDEVISSLDAVAASAGLINDVRPAAAAAPASATAPRKSRRPISLLICHPISLVFFRKLCQVS